MTLIKLVIKTAK